MPKGRRDTLLRVANVNPDSVTTHTDRVLYSAIGMFVLLYFVYATIGGAAFIDAGSNYRSCVAINGNAAHAATKLRNDHPR